MRSDYYNSTPNLTINIDRERAATYGVSTSAIQSLLKNAYSQNYVYLIKQPDDQYQVILEVKDNERATPAISTICMCAATTTAAARNRIGGSITTVPERLHDLVPLRAVTSTKQVVGPQAVNHFDQFTSVTINFNLLPGEAIGDATKFIEDSFAQVHQRPAERAIHLPGRSACLPPIVSGAAIAFDRRDLRHVCDPRNSLRELRPSDHGLVSGDRACSSWRSGDSLDFCIQLCRSTA